MFLRLVLANPLFSLRDINLTLGLLPPRRHVVWRDSVAVESSWLNHSARIFFTRVFSECYAILTSTKKERSSCLWLQSRSVLSSFSVVLMSCKVNFYVYSTISIAVFCLQNLICLLVIFADQVFID